MQLSESFTTTSWSCATLNGVSNTTPLGFSANACDDSTAAILYYDGDTPVVAAFIDHWSFISTAYGPAGCGMREFPIIGNGVALTGLVAQFKILLQPIHCAPIRRIVSHCSRNECGAHAFDAFTSSIQTLRRTTPAPIGLAFQNFLAPAHPASA